VFARAVLGFERRRARRRGIRKGLGGAVTGIQRFGSALNLNVHFHMLAVQGVFFEKGNGTHGFAPAPAPTDLEVARLLAAIRRRIVRLLKRQGIDLEQPSDEHHPTDERLFECPVYAEIQGAAVAGRVATGPRAGRPVTRVGRDLYTAQITSAGPLHAHLGIVPVLVLVLVSMSTFQNGPLSHARLSIRCRHERNKEARTKWTSSRSRISKSSSWRMDWC
jgi:hypothetical protein